jgi:molybdenum cofactor cytidylyltransferase
MGRCKLLLPYNKGTLLEAVLAAAYQTSLTPIIIVLGHNGDKIRNVINLEGFTVVNNPNFRQGQSTSLNAGIEHAPAACQGAMFLLGDQPRITPEVIQTLIHSFNPEQDSLVIPTSRGRRGNPVIIHRRLFSEIRDLRGDTGARLLFQRFKEQIRWVELDDDGLFLDVDTPADYRILLQSNGEEKKLDAK